MASSSSSSPPPCRLHPRWKYKNDVYVSSGNDAVNFLSHLLDAFGRESIKAFSDERLQQGAETMPELFKAIEGSKVSVIIFSKRYPFSESCMQQLAKIMECQKKYLIVIPVFYKVLPSDVRRLKKSFGEAFVEHERNLMPGLDKLKVDLVEATYLAGLDSKVIRPEATLVEAIVNDIVKKLESIADSMVKELESLFGSLCDRLEYLDSSFLNNIELKHLYCKVKEVHYHLENADRYRSYPYWSLCNLFTDLRNLTYDVHVLIDDKANSEIQFNQAVKKIDQWLLRFLDSVNNLVACHDGKRSPIFQQPVPRTVSDTFTYVDANAGNNPSLNLSSSNSRFKEAIFMLEIDDDDEARKKAFRIVSQFKGINSITFGNGMEDNKLTVIGCNLDTISIGTKLRKLCHAELVFLGSAKMPEEIGEEPEANHEVTDQLVKAKKASKFPSSLLSRMCISIK